jgi:hypothetical protein
MQVWQTASYALGLLFGDDGKTRCVHCPRAGSAVFLLCAVIVLAAILPLNAAVCALSLTFALRAC